MIASSAGSDEIPWTSSSAEFLKIHLAVVLHHHYSILMIHHQWVFLNYIKNNPKHLNYIQNTVLWDHFCTPWNSFYQPFTSALSTDNLLSSASGTAWGVSRVDYPPGRLIDTFRYTNSSGCSRRCQRTFGPSNTQTGKATVPISHILNLEDAQEISQAPWVRFSPLFQTVHNLSYVDD